MLCFIHILPLQYLKIHIELDFEDIECKDPIWLEPKTRMDPGPQSPNNKFVECGIKS